MTAALHPGAQKEGSSSPRSTTRQCHSFDTTLRTEELFRKNHAPAAEHCVRFRSPGATTSSFALKADASFPSSTYLQYSIHIRAPYNSSKLSKQVISHSPSALFRAQHLQQCAIH